MGLGRNQACANSWRQQFWQPPHKRRGGTVLAAVSRRSVLQGGGNTRADLDALSQSQEFLEDWNMISLVAAANDQLGALRPGYKYCLKIPGVLGGEYGGSNLATAPLRDIIAFSGHVAKEIQGLPDGAQIRLRVME